MVGERAAPSIGIKVRVLDEWRNKGMKRARRASQGCLWKKRNKVNEWESSKSQYFVHVIQAPYSDRLLNLSLDSPHSQTSHLPVLPLATISRNTNGLSFQSCSGQR